jgi:hypothetical protein
MEMSVYQLDSGASIRRGEHLQTRRGLTLVLHGEVLTNSETAHLQTCHICNEWLTTFAGLARKVGFSIRFRVPACWAQSTKHEAGTSFFRTDSTRPESTT